LRMRRVCAACWLKVAVNRFARLISSMAMPLRERWFVFQIWNTFQQQSRIIMHGSEYPRLCERILTITAVCSWRWREEKSIRSPVRLTWRRIRPSSVLLIPRWWDWRRRCPASYGRAILPIHIFGTMFQSSSCRFGVKRRSCLRDGCESLRQLTGECDPPPDVTHRVNQRGVDCRSRRDRWGAQAS